MILTTKDSFSVCKGIIPGPTVNNGYTHNNPLNIMCGIGPGPTVNSGYTHNNPLYIMYGPHSK